METQAPSLIQKISDAHLFNRGFCRKNTQSDYFQEYQRQEANGDGATVVVLLNSGHVTVEHRLFGNSLKYVFNDFVVAPEGPLSSQRADLIVLIAEQLKVQNRLIHQMSILSDQTGLRHQMDNDCLINLA